MASHAQGHPLQSTVMTISCHACTHVDAPLHFLRNGRHIADMPIDQWMGEAAVMDLTQLGARAMSRASKTSSVRRCDAMAQPTTRRLQASSTTARKRNPPPVAIYVMSATHS